MVSTPQKKAEASAKASYEERMLLLFKELKLIYNNPAGPLAKKLPANIHALNTGHIPQYCPALATYLAFHPDIVIDAAEIEFLRFLLKSGANPTVLHSVEKRLIYKICEQNNILLLSWLRDECGFTIPLDHYSCIDFLKHIKDQPDSLVSHYFYENFSSYNKENHTLLIAAARHGLTPLFKYLVDVKGHAINARNNAFVTPLMMAVKYGREEIVTFLLEKNAELTAWSRLGATVFHLAIEASTTTILQALIHQFERNGHTLLELIDTTGYNIAHWAISFTPDKLNAINVLLNHMSPLTCDPAGRNYAVFACSRGQHGVAEHLITTYKLDIRTPGAFGMNALHGCVATDKHLTAQWLIEKQGFGLNEKTIQGDTALLIAGRVNNVAFLSYVIQTSQFKHLDMNTINEVYRHIGHYLADNGQHALIEELFAHHRLNVAHCDVRGHTMLDIALSKGSSHYATAIACINYIHKLRLSKTNKVSALLSFKQSAMLPELLNLWCKEALLLTNDWVENGQSPLHMACLYASREIVLNLIKTFKLNVNAPNQAGETPLATLVKLKKTDDAVWFQAKCQPKTTKLDALNSSMLQLACEEQLPLLVEESLKNSSPSSITSTRKDGLNALDIAVIKQNISIVNCLWHHMTTSNRAAYITTLQEKNEQEHLDYLAKHGLYTPPPSVVIETPLPSITAIPEISVLVSAVSDDGARESAHKRHHVFNPLAAEWTEKPKCYTHNPFLKNLLDQVCEHFKHTSCEGYLYGSANYKQCPSDFDILLPNINTLSDRQAVHDLLQRFIVEGGAVTASDPVTGEYGYKKSNRYVIPVAWKGFNLEFVVSNKPHTEHAKILDFTVGALYFNLHTLQLLPVWGMTGLVDVKQKCINTIIHPQESFTEDLSRVFRAVRIVAKEGFCLSRDCDYVIKELFSGTDNPFSSKMRPGKMYQQLRLMFESGCVSQNLEILHELGAFGKLFEWLSVRYDNAGRYYTEQLRPFDAMFQPQQAMPSPSPRPGHLLNHNHFFASSSAASASAVSPAQPHQPNPHTNAAAVLAAFDA